MSKKLFFFVLLNFFLFYQIVFSKDQICRDVKEFSNYNYKMKIDKIEIEADNNRKWNINGRKIILDIQKQNPSYNADRLGKINNKLKKKFKATINVKLENGNNCKFRGTIRQQGDTWDHIKLINDGNNVARSLSVSLDTGNINGVTKFYLFLKGTRSVDEVFFVELLRKLNFLAPKSFIVKTSISGFSDEMIFQEKIAKEFLESMSRREGPLFEGRDIFRWTLKNGSDNFLISKLDSVKQINSVWAKKGENYNQISNFSLTKINKYFLSSNIAEVKNNAYINFPVINLDPKYFSNNNEDYEQIINKFHIMMFASSGLHGLNSNNRKFYWNSIKNFFEPIYYDGDLWIEELDLKKINYNVYNYPNELNWKKLIIQLISDIENINIRDFYENLKTLDPYQTEKLVSLKTKIIINNLILLKDSYKQLLNQTSLKENRNLDIYEEAEQTYSIIRKNKNLKNNFLIFKNEADNKYLNCSDKNLIVDCEEIIFDEKEKYKLLSDPVTKNNKTYHFIGYLTKANKDKQEKYFKNQNMFLNQINVNNSIFLYDDGIKPEWDENNSILKIEQINENSRAYFSGGNLVNLNIIFVGLASKNNLIYENNYESEDRIDSRGLTGCLNFVDVFFKNTSIRSSNTNCEDAINIINSNGQIDNIEVSKTAFDGIDLDFSNLDINKVSVESSDNDCIDVSYGNYNFKNTLVYNCGDKGFSIGEKSFVEIESLKIHNSEIGLASKDSSTSNLNNLKINKVNTCIAIYRKKQEFFGSSVKLKNFNCEVFINKIDIDNYSNIQFLN